MRPDEDPENGHRKRASFSKATQRCPASLWAFPNLRRPAQLLENAPDFVLPAAAAGVRRRKYGAHEKAAGDSGGFPFGNDDADRRIGS